MESLEQPKDAVEWLRQEFTRRRSRNPAYSLRAFARSLGVPSGRISELFARKRTLTPALATRIARQLSLTNEQQQDFFSLVPQGRLKAEPEETELVSFAVDSAKLPAARDLIQAFRRHLAEILGEASSADVYNLRITLVPLSKKSKH